MNTTTYLSELAPLPQWPHFFIDLVDPSSRSAADIVEVAAILREFESAGPLTLGLNDRPLSHPLVSGWR
ncbi:MAG: hypothetical protein WCK77_13630 [Verrucomicrobiota bacterium]